MALPKFVATGTGSESSPIWPTSFVSFAIPPGCVVFYDGDIVIADLVVDGDEGIVCPFYGPLRQE